MDKDSWHFTAFASPWSLYEWLRIPFGLSNVPPTFQEFMNECLAGLRNSICIPHLDDILSNGKAFDEHLENPKRALRRLKNFGVKLKAEKCVSFMKEMKYLGKVISGNGCQDSTINTEALEKLREPSKTIVDIRKLLGFLKYFRQSICNKWILCTTFCVYPLKALHRIRSTIQKRQKDSVRLMKK